MCFDGYLTQHSLRKNCDVFFFQYLNDLRERGVRIIIGEFFETSARNIICEAYKQGMTQRQGYVWFLPAWYQHDWYDTDALREERPDQRAQLPNCTTAEMMEVLWQGFKSWDAV